MEGGLDFSQETSLLLPFLAIPWLSMLFSWLFSAECGETRVHQSASPLILEASVAYRLLQGSSANDSVSLSRIVIDGL